MTDGPFFSSLYSDDDFREILASFKQKPDIDKSSLRRDLESAADWLITWRNAEPAEAPSTSEKYWRSLHGRVRKIVVELSKLNERRRSDLEYAAERIAKTDGELPDFPPDYVEHAPVHEGLPPVTRPIWPVGKQIEKTIDGVEWLADCVHEAEQWAKAEKADPGNREDEAWLLFLSTTLGLYRDTAANESYPVHDPKAKDPQAEYKGELLDFWKACCAPLNVATTDSALHSSYRRITAAARARKNLRRRSDTAPS